MSASGDKAPLVETFLRSVQNLADIERLHITQLRSNSNNYVVYYDEFSQYSDALKALNALPKKLTQFSPYISAISK
jgi:septal ring-binding cell division protein DamX